MQDEPKTPMRTTMVKARTHDAMYKPSLEFDPSTMAIRDAPGDEVPVDRTWHTPSLVVDVEYSRTPFRHDAVAEFFDGIREAMSDPTSPRFVLDSLPQNIDNPPPHTPEAPFIVSAHADTYTAAVDRAAYEKIRSFTSVVPIEMAHDTLARRVEMYDQEGILSLHAFDNFERYVRDMMWDTMGVPAALIRPGPIRHIDDLVRVPPEHKPNAIPALEELNRRRVQATAREQARNPNPTRKEKRRAAARAARKARHR